MNKPLNTRMLKSVLVSLIVVGVYFTVAEIAGMGPFVTILLLVCGILLWAFCFTLFQMHIHTRYPAKIGFLNEPPSDALIALGKTLEQMGFESTGYQYRVEGSDNLNILFLHRIENTYAVITQCLLFGNLPLCVYFTVFRDKKGSLTTFDYLKRQPIFNRPYQFIQAIEGVTPQLLYEKHYESLTFLVDRGIPLDPISSPDYLNNLKEGLESQRLYIRQRLPLAAIKLLWDIVFLSKENNRSIMEQRNTPKRVDRLRSLYSLEFQSSR